MYLIEILQSFDQIKQYLDIQLVILFLHPISKTSDSSGSAYLLPTPVFGPTGDPANAKAAISVASGNESLEIFHAVAL